MSANDYIQSAIAQLQRGVTYLQNAAKQHEADGIRMANDLNNQVLQLQTKMQSLENDMHRAPDETKPALMLEIGNLQKQVDQKKQEQNGVQQQHQQLAGSKNNAANMLSQKVGDLQGMSGMAEMND